MNKENKIILLKWLLIISLILVVIGSATKAYKELKQRYNHSLNILHHDRI